MSKKDRIIYKFFKCPSTKISVVVLILIFFGIIFAKEIAPYDPNIIDYSSTFENMSREHLMGTDHMGRDIFSRLLYGGRNTVGYAVLITVATATMGTIIGMLCGWIGGWFDSIIMKFSDVLRAFPGIVIVLIVITISGLGILNVCIAMLVTRWIWYARMARNLTKIELERSSIKASKLAGSSAIKILFRHILFSITPSMIAVLALDFGKSLLAISGYSFLGIGVLPPEAEWGMMISDGRNYMNHPNILIWPGLCILIVVITSNILGDNLRDILEENRT